MSYLIIAIMPVIEFVIFCLVRCTLRAYDQKKCCCPKLLPRKTSTKTLQDYKWTYEGELMDLEYIYSQSWLLCYLAFLFGPMLPVLFIYGFVGMLINDVVVRIRIAYTIRRFPKYDNNLNQLSLIGLSYSIIFYIVSAVVLYSNE